MAERKREMERRYKLISKLHPNRLNSFLEWERETAAKKIQTWWRNSRPDTIDLVKEVSLIFQFSQIVFHQHIFYSCIYIIYLILFTMCGYRMGYFTLVLRKIEKKYFSFLFRRRKVFNAPFTPNNTYLMLFKSDH